MIELILQGMLIGVIITAPIGPTALYIIHRTFKKGYKTGLISSLGAAASDFLFITIIVFNLQCLINIWENHQFIFNFISALILIIIGLFLYRQKIVYFDINNKSDDYNYLKNFTTTFIMTITNPLTIIIFTTMIPNLYLSRYTIPSNGLRILFPLSIFIGDMIWWIGLISFIYIARKKVNQKHLTLINIVVGLAIIGLGITRIIKSVL